MDQAAATTPRPGAFARSASCGVEEPFAPEVVPLRWSMVASLLDTVRALSQQESPVVGITGFYDDSSRPPFISSGNGGPRPGYVYRSGDKGNGYYLTETHDKKIFMMCERYCWLLKKFPVWEAIAKKNVEKETLDCGMTIIGDDTPEMLGITYEDLFQIIKFFDTAEIHEKTKATERLHNIAVQLGGCPELIKLLNPDDKQDKGKKAAVSDADAT